MDEQKANPRLRFEEDRPATKLRHTRMSEGETTVEAVKPEKSRARVRQDAAIRKGYAKSGASSENTASKPSFLRFEEDRPTQPSALRHERDGHDDMVGSDDAHMIADHVDVPDGVDAALEHEDWVDAVGEKARKPRNRARAGKQQAPQILTGREKSGKGVDAVPMPPKLRFEEDRPKPPSKLRHAPMSALKGTVHEQFDEQRDDNVGVSAAHAGERLAEKTGETINRTARKVHAHSQQKRAIRKGYAMAKYGRSASTATASSTAQAVESASEKASRKVADVVRRHRGTALLLLLGIMICFMLNSLSACAPLVEAGLQALIIGTYPAEESDILAAERIYREKEDALQDELDHYAAYHPEYDEVQVEQMKIWHDPYALIALICATVEDSWTIDEVMPIIERLFDAQYELTQTVETVDAHTICRVKLVNKNLSYLPFHVLSHDQVGIYALYMATLGNMPDLFAGNPYASELKDPMLYDVPEEYLTADPSFAKLIEEAEKYIGYPYVWGGSEPETSFDCSGFISWIFTQTGVRNIGRLGATGLYGACDSILPEEARPGDLIFFSGTLGDGVDGNDGITHVGLYVGDGMMIHCGNPISYADLSQTYWQQHFYGFGRIY